MSDISIETSVKLDEALRLEMEQSFTEYETSHGVMCCYKKIHFIMRSSEDELIGILNAYTAYAEVYVEDLWIKKAHRQKGYGKKLLDSLEAHFEGKGFHNINLVTNAFQAPDFYKKCGYELEFTRRNAHHPELTKFFFIKYFKNNSQTQGILP